MEKSPTAFQTLVYDTVRQIPRGKVSTYAAVARKIGCKSPRAIGQALRNNPFAPQVPCHRVIAADRSLGGFNGRTSGTELVRKRTLLAGEGVRFDETNRIARSCVISL